MRAKWMVWGAGEWRIVRFANYRIGGLRTGEGRIKEDYRIGGLRPGWDCIRKGVDRVLDANGRKREQYML